MALRIYVDMALPEEARELLRAETAGHELVFPQQPISSVLDAGEPDSAFVDIDVAWGQPNAQAILAQKHLRFVQISSAGITRYDNAEFFETIRQRQIAFCNSSSVYDEFCAVHTLAFMLAQERHLLTALATITKAGTASWHWLRENSGTLKGKTVLLIGFGTIGERLAELLEPHGAKVLGYRRQIRGNEQITMVDDAGLNQALTEADHVVNILPENPETKHFFDAARLAKLKPGSALHNIGRGSTIDQLALAEALEGGPLAAAWLDVTDPEPLPENHPLWECGNCHITPHTGGGHAGEALSLLRHFLANLKRFEAGEDLLNQIV